jgi:hypothetical protein
VPSIETILMSVSFLSRICFSLNNRSSYQHETTKVMN